MDVILSVLAVIFAPDPGAAAAEMSRVLAPDGRIVLSAWIPAGAMVDMTSAAADAVRQAVGAPAPEPFAWHDRDALSGLLTPYGFVIDVQHHRLGFTAPSARQFLEQETRNHPLAVALLSSSGSARPRRCAPASWKCWTTATKTPAGSR